MSRWSFEPILESYAAVLLCCALLTAMLFAVRPWTRSSQRSRQWKLLALRAGVIVLLTLAMLRPAHVSTQSRPQSATLLVLFDQSRSMGVKDISGGQSRWQQLASIVGGAAPQLRGLSELLDVRIYGFADRLGDDCFRAGRVALPGKPQGEQTDLGAALHSAIQREAGKRLAAVVLLSDGAQRTYSTQYDLQQVARELARMNTPLYTLTLGKPRDQSQARDVAIENLQDQYTVFVKNDLEIRGALRVQGYVNQAIPVRLIVDGPTGVQRSVLGPISLTAQQDDELVDFTFNFSPQVAGAYRLRVEARPQDGELVVANNEMTAYLNVLEGGLRILYLEGNLLGPEQQILRQSLAASADFELDYHPIDPRLRDRWPIDLSDAWSGVPYDVIMIGDVDSTALGNDHLQRIVQFLEQGRGLLMLGGINTLGPGGYRDTPLANALPVNLGQFDRQTFGPDVPVRPDVHLPGPLQMVPTRPHFVTRLAEGESNQQAWRQLPPLQGANRFESLKPQAIRLADSANGDPLLVARQFGAGRVVVFAGDSTHLWWRHGHQETHKRFWRQVMLWLANRDELLRRDVWVNLPRRRFRPGETVPLTAGARAENGDVLAAAELIGQLRLGTDEPRNVRLARQGDDWAAELDDLQEPGEYTVEVTARMDGQEIGQASARFQLQQIDLELADPAANPQLMSLLANLTSDAGGRALPPEQLPALLQELQNKPPEMEIEVESKWRFGDTSADVWPFFLVFVMLLGSEWYLRKKWGLV